MTIDGKDIRTMWDMILLKDSFNSLLQYPKRKAVRYTNYAEVDGIHPDLRKFETESRQVSLVFMIKHASEAEFYDKYEDFFNTINDSGYHTFDPDNGLIYKLRYDKTQSFKPIGLCNAGEGSTSFTISFMEDATAIDGQIGAPSGGIPLKGWYSIDGVDFGDFGVHPDGEIGEILKYPDAKEPFTDGEDYDLSVRRLKHKEVKISAWMRADSKAEFMQNYQAFYNAFAKPGRLSFYMKEINATTYCYYMECTAFNVRWGDKPGAFFSITLCIPVVTWMEGVTSFLTVLKDPVLGLLANEQGKVITFNKK